MKTNENQFKCDWKGTCPNPPYAEVYPYKKLKKPVREKTWRYEGNDFLKGKRVFAGWHVKTEEFKPGWSYLCRTHFREARKRGDTFAWCEAETKKEHGARLKREANEAREWERQGQPKR